MSPIARARSMAFLATDVAAGSPVRNALAELQAADRTDFDDEALVSKKTGRTDDLLQHAAATVPAYGALRGAQLSDFPVVNKILIKADAEAFMSNAFETQRMATMSTSGSTGTPFTVYQDPGKKRRVGAELIHYSGKVGYRVGMPFVFLRALRTDIPKSRLRQWMQGLISIDISAQSHPDVERVLQKIADAPGSRPVVLACASTLDAFRDYFEANGIENAPKLLGIISQSEKLPTSTRQMMQSAFQCPVVSRYSNEENGVLAQDAVTPDEFILNDTNYIFEVLDFESDEPALPGQHGRIVVTDLFNRAMPLIRYDTGDVGKVEVREVGGVRRRVFSEFGGRAVDTILDVNGCRIGPYVVTNVFWTMFPQIRQFQFVQRGPGQYLVKLNVPQPFAGESELRACLMDILGGSDPDAHIDVDYVDEVPILASGKRSSIVNEMNKPSTSGNS